jgi:hypothetical protein
MNRWALLLLVSAVAITCVVGFAAGAAGTEAGTLAVAAAEETQTCPECGYENEPDLNYCIKCGAPLKEEAPGGKVYCPQCGAPSPEGSTFCTACGYALKGEKPGLGASSAPPPRRIGIYFTGDLASYGGAALELEEWGLTAEDDMGGSWAVGGGLAVTLVTRPGAAQLSLELSSDVGYSKINKEFELDYFGKTGYKISLIPIRETVLLGVGVGPRNMVKPFCGAGAGVAILAWECKYIPYEMTLGEGTSVKPVFDIPFGCEFHVTPNFALGVKADYLIIPGDIEMEWEIEGYVFDANASAPDVFLFGGTARFSF